jgi:hypothetical protein
MTKIRSYILANIGKHNRILLFLLSTIFLLKILTLNHGTGAHPDERHIIMSIMKMSFASWESLNPGSFAYGGLPFYLLLFLKTMLTSLGFHIGYDQSFLVGRFLSGLLGIGSCLLLFSIAKSIFKETSKKGPWSLLCATLLASNWFFFQNSRYYTVDIFLTFFTLLFTNFALCFYQDQKKRYFLLMVLSFVLAFSSKISALNLGVFIALIPFLLLAQKKISLPKASITYIAFLFLSFFGACLLQPHAVQNYKQFLVDITRETGMVRGLHVPPYTLQYVGTLSYFYHLKQFFLYTVGPLITLLTFAGLYGFPFQILLNTKNSSVQFLS